MSYAGRDVDIVAYAGASTSGEVTLLQDLAQPNLGGEICTGIQKLVQRFVIKLFTIAGSVKYLPAKGCEFLTDVYSGKLRSSADVFLSFSVAIADMRRQFSAEDLLMAFDDEKFQSAVLTKVQLSGDGIVLYITLTSQAGTAAQAILPISASV